MNAPQNFAQKIKGYKLTVRGEDYSLGDSMGSPNTVWIYPKVTKHNSNVIMLEFDWRNETYSVNIARQGEGTNFHHTIPHKKFDALYFLSFDKFIRWIGMRITSFNMYFYNF
jgi:hypothetical protein